MSRERERENRRTEDGRRAERRRRRTRRVGGGYELVEAVEATEDRLGDWLSISMGDTQWTGTEMKTSAQTAYRKSTAAAVLASTGCHRGEREKLSLQLDSATRRHTDDDGGGGGGGDEHSATQLAAVAAAVTIAVDCEGNKD